MKSTRSNYRIEIRIVRGHDFSEMPHEWFVNAWLEIVEELEKHTSVKPNRTSLVWDTSHKCESCETELDLHKDELKCIHCNQLMCIFCNCGTEDHPICELCIDKMTNVKDW